jgi:hypothetical protein
MPDFEKATTTRRTAKRGYRRVSFLLKTNEYEVLDKMAEGESRTADQQAMYLLRLAMRERAVQAIKGAVMEAEDRRRDSEVEYEEDEVTTER